MSNEELKIASPKDIEKSNLILDHELKKIEIVKGRAQIRVLNLALWGGLGAFLQFILQYGQEWYKIISLGGGN